jgi:hypothetical protein
MTTEPDVPFGIEVQNLGNELRISRRWFYWTSVPLGLLALAWIGLTLCRSADDVFNACNCLFLGLGLLALYFALLSLTNRTEIEVNQQELTIQHGPLPSLSKHKTVPVRDISQLFLKRIKIAGNLSVSDRYWELDMVDRFGEKTQLMGAMPDWSQAQFIKQEIERFLSQFRSEEEKTTTPPHGNTDQPAEDQRLDM